MLRSMAVRKAARPKARTDIQTFSARKPRDSCRPQSPRLTSPVPWVPVLSR